MEPEALLIEALCGRGWDAPVVPDLEAARSLLRAHPELPTRSLAVACVLGELGAVRRALDADPGAAGRPCGPRGWAPVLYAAFSFAHTLDPPGDVLGVLSLLLDTGADPNAAYFVAASDNGFSALYATIAVTGDRTRTDRLLAAGARPSDGNSTYHAVETFDLDLLQALGRAGIDPDDLSYTIKHAIDMGWVAAAKLFLELGADPNAVHPAAGETTLHWAVKRGASMELLERLLQAGADVDARTSAGVSAAGDLLGHTALDVALRLGRAEVVERLRAAGASAPEPAPPLALVHAVARGDGPAADALLSAHPGLLEALPAADRGLVPHWAQHGRRAAVSLAARLGFPLDGTAWMGLTALHWAALRGDAELVAQLQQVGAPVVDLGGYFGTPLHTATHCQWFADGDYAGVLALLGSGGGGAAAGDG